MSRVVWTRDRIHGLLQIHDRQVEKAICLIYDSQTLDEKESESTIYHNKIGFSSFDAKFGTSLAKQIEGGAYLTKRQSDAARNMLVKYENQLVNIITERA